MNIPIYLSIKFHVLSINIFDNVYFDLIRRGRRGRDCMVVGFTTTYAISADRHRCCEVESLSGRDVQYYVIKFVSDL